jgi:hypothetical protein
MKVYQIDYDLRKKRDYQALYERIQSYSNWCRPLESTWIISTTQSAAQICKYLTAVMDGDDGLLVTRLEGEAAGRNLGTKVSIYLKRQLETEAA